jgi:beta-lactamase regulating signal transducer with metallopeptidase domain
MNPPSFLVSPGYALLFKWTCLLALGWVVQGILRHRHARWRLILWRGILCLGLTLPFLHFVQFPSLKIPVASESANTTGLIGSTSSATTVNPNQSGTSPVAQPVRTTPATSLASSGANSPPQAVSAKRIPWEGVLIVIWALGCVAGALRLFRLQRQLSLLQKSCRPAPDLRLLAQRIQDRLDVRREIDVRISDTVTSPFVCGVLKSVITLPQPLADQLSPAEMSALLSHEIAHLHGHDLFWSVAWRWMKAVCWFHPLVWQVPAAHGLACEQEADRIASGQLTDRESYAQLLARLALRVLALPAVETKLTLNGSSQIARRLNHLAQKRISAWNWKHTAAGFGLVGTLFLMTAGCDFSNSSPDASTTPAKVKFKEVAVVVQDENGKPVEGATILPTGFRVKGIHGADAYGWNNKLFGAPVAAVTGPDGKAMVKYPVMGIPGEKELTGALIFGVSHPEFASVFIQTYMVDSSEKPIHLTRGIHLEVSGYFGSDHQPVTEIVPNLNEEMIHTNDWQKLDNGVLAFNKMSPGGHILQLMGRLPSGEIVYSEDIAFTAEKGKDYNYAVEMKPGIRLEGRLDDNVPRPVRNGRVLISVRPKEFPAWNNYADVDDILKKYPNVYPWKSYRPIAEDGTFVFESIPSGGLDVIVHGDGFISQSGGDFSQRNGSKLEKVPGFALPQPFSLVAPTTKIEVMTEPTATLDVTAKTKAGKSVEGATIHVNPNVVRMGGIFGNMRKSSEEPFRTMTPLPNIPYSATTDKNGFAVIRNIPASDRGMDVYDPQYQVPLQELKGWRDRHIRLTFSPGETNHYELTLEPKGKDYIGSR